MTALFASLLLLAACSTGATGGQSEADGGLIQWDRFDVLEEPEATVPWERAHEYMGRHVAVEGTVVRTNNIGSICFLNFQEDWKGKFCVVIFASNFRSFDRAPEEWFRGKRIRVLGKIEDHRGTPQIVLARPEQVTYLDS